MTLQEHHESSTFSSSTAGREGERERERERPYRPHQNLIHKYLNHSAKGCILYSSFHVIQYPQTENRSSKSQQT
mgnify:CR=1 FL=1